MSSCIRFDLVFLFKTTFVFLFFYITKSLKRSTDLLVDVAVQSSVLDSHLGGGEEGHSLIWPMLVSAAKQGMVFKVLRLKQGIQFKRLEQGVVLN